MLLHRLIRPALSILLAAAAPLIAGPSEDLNQLTQDHTQFAFSLYPTIDSAQANLVFSPYSIASCLSMVYLGARADTESQMQKALHLEVDRKNVAKTYAALQSSLMPAKKDDRSYQLNIANAVWVDQGAFLLADFRYAIEQQFKAKLGKINFTMAGNAVSTINGWVSEQTQGKIANLLTADDINAQTRLVLTNAVYFQGQWISPFNPNATQDWPFHPTPDTSSTVKMMHQTFLIPYYENELMQAAAVPFVGTSNAGGNLACVFLLPKSADNFDTMVNELEGAFANWISSLSSQRVALQLPKFTLDTRLNLGDPLEKLGMEDAFDTNANFVGIDGMRDLFLNKVIHQAYFTLDENGVTAAAATAAGMSGNAMPENKPPVRLTLDHPFLFFIVDLKSQEMLFMGKVVQPDEVRNGTEK